MVKLCIVTMLPSLFAVFLYAQANDEILKGKTPEDRNRTIAIDGDSIGLGVKEVERPDGGKDKVYYSITTVEEEARRRQEEKEKLERSMEMLRNIIIDQRKR